MASAEREPIWELGALLPARSRNKASGQGSGAKPPEANEISAIQTLVFPQKLYHI
jgi:hypothetical protein